MHMFKGGLTPWRVNPEWSRQIRAERLAEEAARKKREESGGGDIVARLVMILAGAVFVSMIFGGPGVPMN
jgi:hypothetical protein